MSQRDQDTLKLIHLSRARLIRQFRTQTVLVLFYLAVGILVFGLHFLPKEQEHWPKAVAVVLALIGFSLTYLQWLAGRHEASFERYYDRLDLANRKFDAARTEELKDGPRENLKQHLYTMFVFAELDNLEYVLEKYKLGYVRPGLAERAVRAFRSRCADPGFCQEALSWLGQKEGQERARGYERTTREIVRHITRECSGNRSLD